MRRQVDAKRHADKALNKQKTQVTSPSNTKKRQLVSLLNARNSHDLIEKVNIFMGNKMNIQSRYEQ